jgi:hypothetical protein
MSDPMPVYALVVTAASMVAAYRVVHGRAIRLAQERPAETFGPTGLQAQPRHHWRWTRFGSRRWSCCPWA